MAQILVRNFNTPLKYAMENIAGDVAMSAQSQSIAMQTTDVSTSCLALQRVFCYLQAFVYNAFLFFFRASILMSDSIICRCHQLHFRFKSDS